MLFTHDTEVALAAAAALVNTAQADDELGDVAALVKVLAGRESWRGLGDEALLRRYARARLWPTRAMAGAVDGLWQLFAAPAPGARELRNRGMSLVNRMGPLKRWLVSRALAS